MTPATILSLQDAFLILDTQRFGIPFDAIEYLYHHEADPTISQKITFALKNAYNPDVYYDEQNDFLMPTPLWYAIVAENHLSETLIDPVIGLFTCEEEEEWDLISEQGQVLLGRLCETFPAAAIPRILDALERMVNEDSTAPYFYLSDVIFFLQTQAHKNQMLRIYQHPSLENHLLFTVKLAEAQIKEALPLIKEQYELLQREDQADAEENWLPTFGLEDYREAIEELETGMLMYPEQAQPLCRTRAYWKEHYMNYERHFLEADTELEEEEEFYEDEGFLASPDELQDPFSEYDAPGGYSSETFERTQPKVERNDPCPCGSGKKFKKCHWGKGVYD